MKILTLLLTTTVLYSAETKDEFINFDSISEEHVFIQERNLVMKDIKDEVDDYQKKTERKIIKDLCPAIKRNYIREDEINHFIKMLLAETQDDIKNHYYIVTRRFLQCSYISYEMWKSIVELPYDVKFNLIWENGKIRYLGDMNELDMDGNTPKYFSFY